MNSLDKQNSWSSTLQHPCRCEFYAAHRQARAGVRKSL
jgi:hypothetical protein